MNKQIAHLIVFVFILSGCNQQRFVLPPGVAAAAFAVGNNILPVQVGNCGPNGYSNEPCASVVICTPGTSTCQTIPNILVDTGSYGLRIFSEVISIPLNQETDSSGRALGECAYFGSANDWGTVQTADVQLGGEVALSLPVQVINAGFASVPTPCTSPEESAIDAGYNGILGVGLFNQDCGVDCTTDANNQSYYACVGTTCTNITVTLAQQVSNPIAALPLDNNGVIISLPSIPANGATSTTGTLTLGIGTQGDNMPASPTVYPADEQTGNFSTTFNGTNYNDTAFIDSGSNGIFFPAPKGLPDCPSTGGANGFFCPTSTTNYSGTQIGYPSGPQNIIEFQVANAETLFSTGNNVFNNIGGSMAGGFDWGLPFFFGRTIYVGLDGKSSSLASGPYWAY